MDKPASVVDWDATGHIVEPSSGKKTEGWLGGEKPPAEFLNWLFNLLGLWSQYLNAPDSVTLGGDKLATEANAVDPRLIVEPASSAVADHTAIAKFKDARLWVKGLGSDSAVSLTVNATRPSDGTDKWAKITSSQPAFMLQVSRDGLSFSSMPATQNTAWTDAFIDGEGTSSGWGRSAFFQSEGAAQTTANQQFPMLSRQFNTGGTTARGYIGQFKLSGVIDCRLYVVRNEGTLGTSGSSGLEVVFGATWDHVALNWVRDVTTDITRYVLGAKGFFAERKDGAALGTFTTFDRTLFDFTFPIAGSGTAVDHGKYALTNATFVITGTTADDVNDANPPATTAQANKIGVRNVDKVTAYAITNGSGGVTLNSGYNMTSVTILGTVATFTFNADLADANYEAVVTPEFNSSTVVYQANVFNKAAGSIQVRVFKTTTGGVTSVVDLETEAIGLNLRISGKQTT